MERLSGTDIETGAYDALKAEVQASRETFNIVISSLSVPGEPDAPWIGALSWLSLARSAAAMVANVAPPAAIPVWMLDQAAILAERRYSTGMEQRAMDRLIITTAIKDTFIDGINATERNFWSSRAAQAARLRLQSRLALPEASALYRPHKGLTGSALVEVACRGLIHRSEILVSESGRIRSMMSDALTRIFGKVYQIYLASPLRKGVSLAVPPVTKTAFREGNIPHALAKMEAFASLREIEEICARYERAWYGLSTCTDSFRGGVVEGKEGFLYVMSHAGAFEVAVHDSSLLTSLEGDRIPYRVVELQPRREARRRVGLLSDAQIPRMLRAIDQAFFRAVGSR